MTHDRRWGLGRSRRVQRAIFAGLAGVLVLALPGAALAKAGAPAATAKAAATSTWKLTFSDEFTGSKLDTTKWGVYNGVPKGGTGRWDPSLAWVQAGMLVLRSKQIGGQWATSGVSNARAGSQKYGKWEVRFRIDAGNGIGYALLLYPASGAWPPEVDFAEDGGGTRQSTTATLHWAPGNQQSHATVAMNATVWHVMGVIVQPGYTQYTVDGVVFATMQRA